MASRKRRRPEHPPSGPVVPAALASTLSALIGGELPALEAALCSPAPTSIRLDPAKPFEAAGDPVPWCNTGRYLNTRPSFTFDPLFHAGAYYVQEASSMFLEQAIQATGLMEREIVALDLCAAPGGKSTHLRSLLSAGSLLVANEVDPRRRSVLQENLWKWGGANVVITGSDPSVLQVLPEVFDLVVVDAPCSGEGMFRKDPFARQQWSTELVGRCTTVQRHILLHAWHALAPGGVLIHSTCTWEQSENEDQVKALVALGGTCVDIPFPSGWGIERNTTDGVIGHRFYPHRLRGEGFFLSAVRKPGTASTSQAGRAGTTSHEVRSWLNDPEVHELIERNATLHAIDARWAPVLDHLQQAMHVVSPGIPIAEQKAGRWRPHPALALNAILNEAAFPRNDLDHDDAVRYLRGEALSATQGSGIALACHQGYPLGWLQGANSRWNNRWPTAWRIRTQQAGAPPVPWATQGNATGT